MRVRGKAPPALIAFAARLGNDDALRKRIDGLRVGEKSQTLSDIVWIASEAGYFFSKDELESGWRALASNELSEVELDAVAGGVRNVDYPSFQAGVSLLARIIEAR